MKRKIPGLFNYSEITSGRRKHKVSVNDGKAIITVDQTSLKNKFKIRSFYVIIDKCIVEIEKQKKSYLKLDEKISFLTNQNLNDGEIRLQAINLVEAYPSDLEVAFVNAFLIFKIFQETGMSANEIVIKQINTKMVTSFPNVNIAFRICLSIFVDKQLSFL